MTEREIQARVRELWGERVVAFHKDSGNLFNTDSAFMESIFWLRYRRNGKYVELAIPTELFQSNEKDWLKGWNERIDFLFSRIT